MNTQENRTERLTIALTPSEQNDARLVAALRNSTLSDLIREMTIAEVQSEAMRIREMKSQSQESARQMA